MQNRPYLTIDRSLTPPSCLPTHLNTDNLIDVTPVHAMYRVYFDSKTGKTHDGAKYMEEERAWQIAHG